MWLLSTQPRALHLHLAAPLSHTQETGRRPAWEGRESDESRDSNPADEKLDYISSRVQELEALQHTVQQIQADQKEATARQEAMHNTLMSLLRSMGSQQPVTQDEEGDVTPKFQ